MKKKIYLTLIVLSFGIFTACGKENDNVTDSVPAL